jgi:hypothetical protein
MMKRILVLLVLVIAAALAARWYNGAAPDSQTYADQAVQHGVCPDMNLVGRQVSTGSRFEPRFAALMYGHPYTPMIAGRTNLPTGIELTVSLERPASSYYDDAKATVGPDGCFAAGPFTQSTKPINPGSYVVRFYVSMLQPKGVRTGFGDRGQNIFGPLVGHDRLLGKSIEFKTTYTVGSPDAAADAAAQNQAASEAGKRQAELRSTIILLATRRLKNDLKDPASADWVSVLADDSARVVCIVLRARNGFGALDVHDFVDVDGSLKEDDGTAWNRYCAGKRLHDMTMFTRGVN